MEGVFLSPMITYNSLNVDVPAACTPRLSRWIEQVARTYQKVVGEVNYVFVDDAEILRLNREFLGHDYFTDHIGFDRSRGRILSGDIYISLDTVRTNGELYAADAPDSYMAEFHRVVIHGLLHLCGIKDKTPEERQQMEQAENKALALL